VRFTAPRIEAARSERLPSSCLDKVAPPLAAASAPSRSRPEVARFDNARCHEAEWTGCTLRRGCCPGWCAACTARRRRTAVSHAAGGLARGAKSGRVAHPLTGGGLATEKKQRRLLERYMSVRFLFSLMVPATPRSRHGFVASTGIT